MSTFPTFTEELHTGGFMVSHAPGRQSFDTGVITGDVLILAGTVLGKITNANSGTYAANGGNTGNFTSSAVTAGAGSLVGTYRGEFIAATVFNLYDPNGELVGEGHTGTAFAGEGLGFTITAGGTPAVAGDGFTIVVAANASVGMYTIMNPAGTNGSQNAAAILYADTDTSVNGGTNVNQTIVTRNCEVNASELVWYAGMTNNQINAATAQLAALGIIARPTPAAVVAN